MKTNAAGLLVAMCVALCAHDASADALDATLQQPIAETSHAVRLTVEDGIANFRVRRTFANQGERHEEAVLTIRLPSGAAATGLRIRVGDTWYDGELMEREKAAEMYRELTGLGPHLPRDPALLSWMWSDRLELRVFPVPPSATATVEYTLTSPTEYRDGVTVVSYPMREEEGGEMTDPVITVANSNAARLVVDGMPAAAEQPVVLRAQPADPRCAQLGLASNCVVSAIEAPEIVASSVRVHALVRHTYASDVRVVLGTPSGQRHELWSNTGGGDNDIEVSKSLEAWHQPAGSWLVGVDDTVGLDVGVLADWSIESNGLGVLAARDLPLHVPDAGTDAGMAKIELTTELDEVRARFAHVGRKKAHVSRLEIDVPARLSQMPKETMKAAAAIYCHHGNYYEVRDEIDSSGPQRETVRR